jgi:hypothetical protein
LIPDIVIQYELNDTFILAGPFRFFISF